MEHVIVFAKTECEVSCLYACHCRIVRNLRYIRPGPFQWSSGDTTSYQLKMTSKVISEALPGRKNFPFTFHLLTDVVCPVPTARIGFADIVGFGVNGVVILRNSIVAQSFSAIQDFGYNAGGWRVDKHVRLLGDTSGKGVADVVGFGENGVLISFNNGDNTFTQPAKMVLADFAYNAGSWRMEKHIRVLADIRNVGRCDIVGFGDGGVLVSQNNGGGIFSPAKTAINDFGVAQGWQIDKHLRFLAPVTGNGRQDIVGFGENAVVVSRNNGDGTFAPAKSVLLQDFCRVNGWHIDSHPRFLADLTGLGRVDIIGCAAAGVYVSMNDGNGNFGNPSKVLDDFCTQQGWQVSKHPRFIADLRGTKRGDIIGFGNQGVYVSFNIGNGTFQAATLVLEDFGANQGWKVDKHPRFVVDLTGDGRADIIGFGEKNVFVSLNDGKGGFGPAKSITETFGFDNGEWSQDKTVRYVANLVKGR